MRELRSETLDRSIGIWASTTKRLPSSKSHGHKRENWDVKGEGNALTNIGVVYINFGQYKKALEYFQKAITRDRHINNIKGEGISLGNIGLVYRNLGQYEKTLQYYQKALNINGSVFMKRGITSLLPLCITDRNNKNVSMYAD